MNVVSALRVLFRFWKEEHIVNERFDDLFDTYKLRKKERIPSFYTAEEVATVENSVSRSSSVGKRNYVSRYLSEYLPHECNASPNTISSYRDAFVQFIDYMKDEKGISVDRLQLKHLTRECISEYLVWLLDVRNCSPATRNYRLAAIHSLCKYLQYAAIDIWGMAENTLY